MTERGRALHGLPPVQLEDIRDLRQYIGGIVARRWGTLPADEQDELALEGIAIVYHLHKHDWNPQQCASFRIYCTTYLPKRLIDHWRKEMRRRTGYDKFTGEYETVTSLDTLSVETPEHNAGRKRGKHGADFGIGEAA